MVGYVLRIKSPLYGEYTYQPTGEADARAVADGLRTVGCSVRKEHLEQRAEGS